MIRIEDSLICKVSANNSITALFALPLFEEKENKIPFFGGNLFWFGYEFPSAVFVRFSGFYPGCY